MLSVKALLTGHWLFAVFGVVVFPTGTRFDRWVRGRKDAVKKGEEIVMVLWSESWE